MGNKSRNKKKTIYSSYHVFDYLILITKIDLNHVISILIHKESIEIHIHGYIIIETIL